MIFKSITLKEGVYEKHIDFTESVNLIYSDNNSVGKTTLLRLLLYSIGYAIPSTKGIKFSKCVIQTKIEINNEEYTVNRFKDSIIVLYSGKEEQYLLPDELTMFHSKVFNTNNIDMLNNLLGVFYLDQEKGWTLLNRGTVIGKITFNIETLVRGLSDINISDLISRKEYVSRELGKYKQMQNIAEYQNQVNEYNENIVYKDFNTTLQKDIDILYHQKKQKENDLRRIINVIKDNNDFKKYIEKMKISIRCDTGEIVQVKESNIVGFSDNLQITKTKRKLLRQEILKLEKRINILEQKAKQNSGLVEVESIIETFDSKISQFKIDEILVNRTIEQLEKKKKQLQDEISRKSKSNYQIIGDLYKTIVKYAKELDVQKYIDVKRDFIFTSDLKSLSGAILHKLVFIFRLAYINAIQMNTGKLLPIILDSPTGKEIDLSNITDMMNILKRDYQKNQIIIASIHTYDFDKFNLIEIKGRLIDQVNDDIIENDD